MLSGIIMLVIGPCLLAWSIYRFRMRRNYTGIVFLILGLLAISGGTILIVLSI